MWEWFMSQPWWLSLPLAAFIFYLLGALILMLIALHTKQVRTLFGKRGSPPPDTFLAIVLASLCWPWDWRHD